MIINLREWHLYGLFLSSSVPITLVILQFGFYQKGKQHVVRILWENTGVDLHSFDCFVTGTKF